MAAYLNPTVRGADFLRVKLAQVLTGSAEDAMRFIEHNWGQHLIARAAVAPTSGTDLEVSAGVRAEFTNLVTERSVLGRLPGLRPVSPNTRHLRPDNFSTAAWVEEGAPAPVSRFDTTGFTIPKLKKACTTVVLTAEAARDPKGEAAIRADITRACVAALDSALLDPAGAGDAATPTSITYGAPSSASTGDPAADCGALLADFSGDLANAVFITDQNTATRLALYRDTSGVVNFPDAALVGGSILGLPLLISRYVPHDSSGGSLVLVDGGSIAAAVGEVEISRSRHGTVLADTAPAVGADAVITSLWQSNLVALMAVIFADWLVVRPGAVAVVTGASYA